MRSTNGDINPVGVFERARTRGERRPPRAQPARVKASTKTPGGREIKTSATDPEGGNLTREGKPQGFFYLDHRTVDGKHALITDTFVAAGKVHDLRHCLARLDRQCQVFAFESCAAAWMLVRKHRPFVWAWSNAITEV